MKNFKLDKENLMEYFKKTVVPNLLFEVDLDSPMGFEEISQFTNVNYLFRVEFGTKSGKMSVILKHAQDFVKVKPEMGFDVRRNYYEAKVLKRFGQIWGKGVVPEVYYHDEEHKVNVLEDFGEDCLVMASEFEQDKLHPEICGLLGEKLAILHSSTLETGETVRETVEEENEYRKFYLDFKMAGSVAIDEKATHDLVEEANGEPWSLIWGDPVTKNILISSKGVHLIDFEGSLSWDPAFDLGHMYAHWLLKYLEKPGLKVQVQQDIEAILQAYKVEMLKNIDLTVVKSIEERGSKYAGATILHRLNGLSQFKFSEERRQSMLGSGKRLLEKGGSLYE
jgi:5-methylthioribose kinase